MKVSELSGAQLDYWVAKAEGYDLVTTTQYSNEPLWRVRRNGYDKGEINSDDRRRELDALPIKKPRAWEYSPSTNWTQGGPIIERERIAIEPFKDTSAWGAFKFETGDCEMRCETPLVAAMRCYVACKFGEKVNEK